MRIPNIVSFAANASTTRTSRSRFQGAPAQLDLFIPESPQPPLIARPTPAVLLASPLLKKLAATLAPPPTPKPAKAQKPVSEEKNIRRSKNELNRALFILIRNGDLDEYNGYHPRFQKAKETAVFALKQIIRGRAGDYHQKCVLNEATNSVTQQQITYGWRLGVFTVDIMALNQAIAADKARREADDFTEPSILNYEKKIWVYRHLLPPETRVALEDQVLHSTLKAPNYLHNGDVFEEKIIQRLKRRFERFQESKKEAFLGTLHPSLKPNKTKNVLNQFNTKFSERFPHLFAAWDEIGATKSLIEKAQRALRFQEMLLAESTSP